MSEYEDILKLIDAEHETYIGTTAQYIPKLRSILEKEGKSKEEIKDRILADCDKYWTRQTIMDALGDDFKDVKQREAGKQKGKIKKEIMQITNEGRTETEPPNKVLAGRIQHESINITSPNEEKTLKKLEKIGMLPKYEEEKPNYEDLEIQRNDLETNLQRATARIQDLERNYEKQINDLKEKISTLEKPNFKTAADMVAITPKPNEDDTSPVLRSTYKKTIGELNTRILELKDQLNEVTKYTEVMEIKGQKIALVIEATNLKSVRIDEAKSRMMN